MEILVSQRVNSMEESATLKMAAKARELRSQGHDIISLSIGEPDFDTPDHIKKRVIEALEKGKTKYTPVPGIPELRDAICRKFKRDNNLDYTRDQIVVSNGAKQSIANLCLALLNKGEEAILLTPYWVSYKGLVEFCDAIPVEVSAGIDQDFKVTGAQLEAAITDKTQMIIFSSPCNPTGSVYTYEELKDLARVIKNHPNIVVVSDEIYEYINFSDKHVSIGTLEEVADQVVTVNGFSKGFAMTGWRLGYLGAPKWLAEACIKVQGNITSGANSFAQYAAAFALDEDMGPTTAMKDAFLTRKKMVHELLSDIPDLQVNDPKGAFYMFPDISAFFGRSYDKYDIKDSNDLAEFLLEDAHVALVAGDPFGNNNCIRLSYAASEEQLREAISRMKTSLAKLS